MAPTTLAVTGAHAHTRTRTHTHKSYHRCHHTAHHRAPCATATVDPPSNPHAHIPHHPRRLPKAMSGFRVAEAGWYPGTCECADRGTPRFTLLPTPLLAPPGACRTPTPLCGCGCAGTCRPSPPPPFPPAPPLESRSTTRFTSCSVCMPLGGMDLSACLNSRALASSPASSSPSSTPLWSPPSRSQRDAASPTGRSRYWCGCSCGCGCWGNGSPTPRCRWRCSLSR